MMYHEFRIGKGEKLKSTIDMTRQAKRFNIVRLKMFKESSLL